MPATPSIPVLPVHPVTLPRIGFIGGGNMATAMIRALLALPAPPVISVAEPDPGKRADFTALGLSTHADNGMITAGSDLVVLAIKPQVASLVVPQVGAAWSSEKLLVSILAGMPTSRLQGWLPAGAKVVRAMPNTPLAIGQGMVGICAGAHAQARDLDLAEALFASCGKVLRLADEARMDAITAVSGSGPAYVFAFAEALLGAATALGFSAAEARLLVEQTLQGSTRYLCQSDFEAARLRVAVTSPGGTTAAALAVLERHDWHGMWREALAAAERRGRELAAS
jgi:pyrroline-5-carboxylate reductase